ncbi:hypothetical protein ASC87_19530 [Rhizobacter sp. Root1221]|nr:hypothetical protein ASC87_19530 [Rhizobacter sp. Root1221]
MAIVMPLLTILILRGRKPAAPKPLPETWDLTGRPVFTADERRIYRLLREALPHHIILSKLPLVRFCQPTDATKVRYWFELLGSNHVTFAVCSANGRVLAAIDLEAERGHSNRVHKIKQSVLDACRVRYLVCPADHLPSVGELQLLVPHSGAATRAPLPVPSLNQARDSLASTVANRRAERTALWQDSTLFQDSFFAMDSRFDSAFAGSDFSVLSDRPEGQSAGARSSGFGQDIGGIVDDEDPRIGSGSRR